MQSENQPGSTDTSRSSTPRPHSGKTSSTNPPGDSPEASTSSHARRASDASDTTVTARSEAGDSTASITYPGAPANTPFDASSVVGSGSSGPDTSSLDARLAIMAISSSASDNSSVAADDHPPSNIRDDIAAANGVKEHSAWGEVAIEDLGRSLARLTRLAQDEHSQDGSKSVEEYFSIHLAAMVKANGVRFDPKYLH
ncbi:hypothetical protein MBLNU230_g8146t1 [Neophaeotheca triangularis]